MKKGFVAIVSTAAGVAAGTLFSRKSADRQIAEKEKKTDKFRLYYNILLEWLALKQEGKSLDSYFVKKGCRSIAIYGMGELGVKLLKELKDSRVEVACAIDKNDACGYIDVELKEPGEPVAGIDMVVVTPLFAFDEIRDELGAYISCPIVSLEEVIYEN